MKIMGVILPFVGFSVNNIDNDGYPCQGPSHWKASCFQVEWLGFAVVLFVGRVYKA